MAEQKKYPYSGLDFFKKFADTIAERVNKLIPDVPSVEITEKQTIIMNNTLEYPFNDSNETVSLEKVRDNNDYNVFTEIVSPASGEQVGRIVITDKLTNGFKVAFTGGAKSVTLKCTIKGGMSNG